MIVLLKSADKNQAPANYGIFSQQILLKTAVE